MSFKPVDPKVDFPKQEEEVLKFWQDNDIFKKSVSQREGAEDFVFYDGPPFATGLPHFGHFIPSTIKDIIPRYQTMKGKRVERRFGWDCHGLPVENLIEKELGLNSKHEIEALGIDIEAMLRCKLLCQLDREAVCIVELECKASRDHP